MRVNWCAYFFCMSNVKNLQKLCQEYTLLSSSFNSRYKRSQALKVITHKWKWGRAPLAILTVGLSLFAQQSWITQILIFSFRSGLWDARVIRYVEYTQTQHKIQKSIHTKVGDGNLVNFFDCPYFWLLNDIAISMIGCVSSTWWFSCHLDDIWASHLYKNQITPTILHNYEWYPPSYDTLCGRGRQIKRLHVTARC